MSADLGAGSLGLVRALLPGVAPARSNAARLRQLADGVTVVDSSTAWLLHTVIARSLPVEDEVTSDVRLARLDGTAELLARLRRERRRPGGWLRPPVRVVRDATLVDVHETVSTSFVTGIQRVAREITDRWRRDHEVTLVGWSTSHRQLMPLRPGAWEGRRGRRLQRHGIAPTGGTYFLPEVTTFGPRNSRALALAAYSGLHSAMVGHDCIPLTVAETTGMGMPGAFAKYLAVAARMDTIACVSHASETEYLGWADMLAGAGMSRPAISAVPLPGQPGVPDDALRTEAERLLLSHRPDGSPVPMVLCVGSHEPRKNHAAVLQAAELLWRDGHEFSLVFLGGNSWNSDVFHTRLTALARAGRDVRAMSGVRDGVLWWAYRLARVTVFPSLDEGFGLPVAESLALGTPVVTSAFGSMAEIARDGGCLLVDPADDDALASAIGNVLSDDVVAARLAAEASARPVRTWDEYAASLWRTAMA